MPLYTLTYEFESDGGNVQYQTAQAVERDAAAAEVEASVVTTGIDLDDSGLYGTAVVEVGDDVDANTAFDSATAIDPVSLDLRSADGIPDPRPEEDVERFRSDEELAALLEAVDTTPGRGMILYSNLSRCHPFERDLWFVPIDMGAVEVDSALSAADVVDFYRANQDLLEDEPALNIGVFHSVEDPGIRLCLVASLTDPDEADSLAERSETTGAVNFARFELTKTALVVGSSTHGVGHYDALFRDSAGETVSSRELAYRACFEGLSVYFHPLGILVEGTLYHPVEADGPGEKAKTIGTPIHLDTYRGGTGKPWQFGLTRYDGRLLLTQARAGPEKFDPVLKPFPIERRPIGSEPLVFSHTVSRRTWSEDPKNLHVQSHRSEGLRTQLLYDDGQGWHLIQPDALDAPSEEEGAFESTQLDGATVRSSLLRADQDGESKATVEHEYRITASALDSVRRLYVLSYHEVNEESVETLQWEIANATAYEIVAEDPAGDSR